MQELFLGIDSSTQGTKVVCIEPDSGKSVYVDAVNYDLDLPRYQTRDGVIQAEQKNLSEADPNMWIEALHLLFRRMKQNGFPLGGIKAISVSGQQHGLVSLDAEGNLTRSRSKLWNDYSTQKECELITSQVGGAEQMIAEVGNTQRPGYTAGKIYHMYRHEPDAAQRTATFFLVHNFINWHLTGGREGGVRAMEPGDVSGMALRHPGSDQWSRTVCEAISPDLIDKLPPVRPSDQMIGAIGRQWIEQYGFSPECLIDAGSGDNMYGAIGTGNIEHGLITISLGTSGTAYTIFNEPYIDPQGEIASFCDSTGKYMPLLCVSNMANGYNKVLEIYGIDHQKFSRMMSETPAGNQGRMLFPWYMGERTPDLPQAAPLYWGFDLSDFTQPVICRAVLEGHVLNLFDGYRRMPVSAKEIRLTGGLSRSDAWRQTIADIFETETVPVKGEGAALGAAIHAAWVYHKEHRAEMTLQKITAKFVEVENERRKYPQNREVYREMKMAFREVSHRVRKSSGEVDPFNIFNRMRG